jgi:hypothetical protein
MEEGADAAVVGVSKMEADMRVLLRQLTNAAALERKRGQEQLETVVRALRTILTALSTRGDAAEEDNDDDDDEGQFKRQTTPYLRLDSSAQEVADLLALRTTAPLRYTPQLLSLFSKTNGGPPGGLTCKAVQVPGIRWVQRQC